MHPRHQTAQPTHHMPSKQLWEQHAIAIQRHTPTSHALAVCNPPHLCLPAQRFHLCVKFGSESLFALRQVLFGLQHSSRHPSRVQIVVFMAAP